MTQLKAVKTEEIEDLTKRLKAINDYIQCAMSDLNSSSEQTKLILKQRVTTYAQQELDEVSKEVKDKIMPLIESATSKYSTYLSLLKIPKLEEIPGYLVNLASILFGEQITQLGSILATYAEPISRLTAELNRTKNLTISTLSQNNIINLQMPDMLAINSIQQTIEKDSNI